MTTIPKLLSEAKSWPEDQKTAEYFLKEVIDRYQSYIEIKPNPRHRNYLTFHDVESVLDLYLQDVKKPFTSFLKLLFRTIPNLNQNQLYHLIKKSVKGFDLHVKPVKQSELEQAIENIQSQSDEKFAEIANRSLESFAIQKKKEETKHQF